MAVKGAINTLKRVAVVDDDEDTRFYFRDILQFAADFEFAGEFPNAAKALAGIPHLRVDLVLMDIQMPDLDGIECTKRLKYALPRLKIIIITGTHNANSVKHSLHAGADAYLIKPFSAEQCLATIQFAIGDKNRRWTHAAKWDKDFNEPEACPSISPRENDVLKGLAEGLLYKEIADKLGISYAAVHKYQHNIFQKLHVSNRSEAIRIWLNNSHAIRS